MCEHGKNKTSCKECNPNIMCEHGKHKRSCKTCSPNIICEHGKHKSSCKECTPSRICEHNFHKQWCKACNPNLICKASHEPYNNKCVTYGNQKYDGFCTFRFINLFPNDPKSIKLKSSKELKQ